MSQGLDVVHQRRVPPHAALVRARRGKGRRARPAVQVLDDGGLLAGHVPARDAGHLDRHRVQARRGSLLNRVFQQAQEAVLGPVHAQVRLARADRLRGERHAVQYQVREPAQQQLVLDAGGLALRAVSDQHLASRPGRDRAHLAPGREARPAPAGQARGLHDVDEPLGPAQCGHRPMLPLVPRQAHELRADAREQAGQARRRRRRPGRVPVQRDHRTSSRAPATSRQAPTASTQAAQVMVNTMTQVALRSVPMPTPCATATGQHA